MRIRQLLPIFLATLSGACFGVAVSTYLLTNGLLSGGLRAYIVQSGSMEPALSIGSVVITKAAESYKKGEIITFSTGGRELTTHRVVSVETEDGQTVFRTKGDANEEADSWSVTESQIVGRQILSIPKLGYLADFVKTPKGFVILVVIPASIIVYEELKAVFHESRKLILKKRNGKSQNSSVMSVIPIVGIVLLLISPTASFSFDTETSLSNIFGGTSPSATPTPTASPEPEAITKIVINEFLPNPGVVHTNEWVEIFNAGNTSVDLTNWKLKDTAQSPKSISALGILNPGEYAVFDSIDDGWLNNSGEESLNLIDASDVVVDSYIFAGTTDDQSIGRNVDGTGSFQSCGASTKGTSNDTQC